MTLVHILNVQYDQNKGYVGKVCPLTFLLIPVICYNSRVLKVNVSHIVWTHFLGFFIIPKIPDKTLSYPDSNCTPLQTGNTCLEECHVFTTLLMDQFLAFKC